MHKYEKLDAESMKPVQILKKKGLPHGRGLTVHCVFLDTPMWHWGKMRT